MRELWDHDFFKVFWSQTNIKKTLLETKNVKHELDNLSANAGLSSHIAAYLLWHSKERNSSFENLISAKSCVHSMVFSTKYFYPLYNKQFSVTFWCTYWFLWMQKINILDEWSSILPKITYFHEFYSNRFKAVKNSNAAIY